jgi:serine phosphatase RsbU (regulator of sigma subunit)
MIAVEAAVAKIGKYATSESGDTFEMVERPRGGISFVLADGQRSGQGAKFISNLVARKAISLLGEGVREEAAAQAAHDYLYAYRRGKVSSTLSIVSLLPRSRRIVIARNNPVPVVVIRPDGTQVLDEPSQPLGWYAGTSPVMSELAMEEGVWVVVATDGLPMAGARRGARVDVAAAVESSLADGVDTAEKLAAGLMSTALTRDDGRPADDISILTIAVHDAPADDRVRRLGIRYPLVP